MRKILLFGTVLAMMASCTSEDFTGDQSLREANESGAAISFTMNMPTLTRAENTGATAAGHLGNQFIVYGEKSETNDGKAAATGKLVFPNYQVNYLDNTAYTTTSNTMDWEYVGYTHSLAYQTYITTKDGSNAAVRALSVPQTIKYWDYSATSYTFTAVSAARTSGDPAKTDIENGYIKIQKNTSGSTVYDKGYTIIVTADADLTKLYLADRKVISQGTGTDRNAKNAYGGNVTFNFRNVLSQVRVGIYETIPGYDISSITFYVDNGSGEQTTEAKVSTTSAFGAICPNIKGSDYAGTLTVTYGNGTTYIVNHPIISASGDPNTNLILGTNTSTVSTTSLLGTTSTSPTWDTSGGAYTTVMPQASNTTNLTLKCDYTLYNELTKETIEVSGATAAIPHQYLQWKPNYKYTYLFKISPDTNGSTGQGVAGLYPITFDAVETIADDGKAEYITTVSEPSITTFGVKGDSYSIGKSDYEASTDVYAVVEDGASLATLSASNFQLYTVTTSDATNFPIDEASVAEALIEAPTLNATQATNAKIKLPTNPGLTYQKTVPAEDGTIKTLDDTYNKAATFTTAAATKYALVYMKTAATYSTDGGKTYATSGAFNAAGTLYTDAACTTVASSYADSSTTYYKRTAVTNKGEYVVKIVTTE